jgi:hypothetical protein
MEIGSFKPLILCALFLLFLSLGNCQVNGDPWTDITSSDTYKKQPACIQTCLLNVASQIPPCVDYGCVCTGDSLGTNFVAGFTDVSACAQESCGNPTDANTAVNAFRDICLIQQGFLTSSATSTSTVNTPAALPVPTVTTLSNSTVTINITLSASFTSTSTSSASQASQSQFFQAFLHLSLTEIQPSPTYS